MKKLISVVLVFCMLFSCIMANAAFTALESDENIVRIGIFADSHVLTDSSVINKVISTFESLDGDLDGILMNGDIVANAPAELLSELYTAAKADAKLSSWLNKKPSVTTDTRTIGEAEYSVGTNSGEAGLVWVMGNHEFNTDNSGSAQPEAWKKFQDETGFGIRGNVTMGGYHFIYSAAQGYTGIYTAEEQTWMMAELEKVLADESYAGKPVFLALHHPIPESYRDTTNGVNGSNFIAGTYTQEFINYVKSQPRIIEFSAHTHYPIQDPAMIRQPMEGGFTAVQVPFSGNGSFTLDRSADIRTASQEDSYAQALMMEINKNTNVVTIKRLNVEDGEYIGNDWTIDVGALALGNGYNYTDARYENGTAPVFDEGDVTVSDITASTAKVTFPAATRYSKENETNYAHIYEVKAIRNGIVDFKQSMVSDYYKATQEDSFTMDVSNLDAGSVYTVEVAAISAYGKKATIASGEFATEENGNQDTGIVDTKEILAGVDDENVNLSSNLTTVDTATAGLKRWVAWIEASSCYSEYTFTPNYTGNYELVSTVSFGDSALSTEPTVAMSVDGVQIGEAKTVTRNGANSAVAVEFGNICLIKGQEYTIRTTLSAVLGSGIVASIWGSRVSYSGVASDEDLQSSAGITLKPYDDANLTAKGVFDHKNNVTAANIDSINSSRFHWWVGDNGYIEWSITPVVTGIYELSTLSGYLVYDPYTAPTLEMLIDGNSVGTSQPTVFDGVNTANKSVFGEVLLMEGQTYTLRLRIVGSNFNAYLDSACLTYKRAADESEFWKDSVTVDGWDPAEKYVAGITENFGVIIAQSNHYATYNVTPGAGFYKLSITYGAGSSLEADAPVTLKVNGKDMGTIIAPDNDCYWPNAANEACTLDMGIIELDEGINTITLGHTGAADAAYYSVGSLTVTAITEPVASIYRGSYADADNEITEIEDGTVTAYTRLPRSLSGQNVFVVFAVYEVTSDNQNRLVGADSKSVTAGAAEGVVLSVSDISKAEGSNYRYRVFYLDDIDTLKPLF